MKKLGPHDLFELHATHGVPLDIGIMMAKGRGYQPGLAAFFFAAMVGGWSPEAAMKAIKYACRENAHPFEEDRFWEGLAAVSTRCGHDFKKCLSYVKDSPKYKTKEEWEEAYGNQ